MDFFAEGKQAFEQFQRRSFPTHPYTPSVGRVLPYQRKKERNRHERKCTAMVTVATLVPIGKLLVPSFSTGTRVA